MIDMYIHLTWWRYQMGTFPMSSVDYPHKVQCRGALIFSFICAWTNGWTNNQDAGDLNWLWHYCDEAVVNCHSTKIWQTCQSRYRFCGLIFSIPSLFTCLPKTKLPSIQLFRKVLFSNKKQWFQSRTLRYTFMEFLHSRPLKQKDCHVDYIFSQWLRLG